MRVGTVFLLGLAVAAVASSSKGAAEELDELDLNGEQATEEAEEYVAPDLAPFKAKALLLETFDEDWETRWIASTLDDFPGTWKVGPGPKQPALPGDVGLILQDEAKRHAISAMLGSPLDPREQDIVIQYEVRLHVHLACGGAYMKVIRGDHNPETFGADTGYGIMFGPDHCGTNNKVHFIYQSHNPETDHYQETHLQNPPRIMNDRLTHLYTLIVRTDNTFEVLIDQESVKKGSLLDEGMFEPPAGGHEEIDDPEDSKPKDWVDEARIEDPDAVKPDDWDEDAPAQITDPEAEMPDGWLESEPAMIPDPDAEKPEDWDDEEDGEFEAPEIENAACSVGCGDWVAPLIPNPEYKGPWITPMIDNPEYIGEWAPKKIPNPNYFQSDHPHAVSPMTAVGFELWTMQDGIEFDNIYIGTDEDDARAFGEATWREKHTREQAADDALHNRGGNGLLGSMQGGFNNLIQLAMENAVAAVATALLGTVSLLFVCSKVCCGSDGPETRDPVTEVKAETTQTPTAEADSKEEATKSNSDKTEAGKTEQIKRRRTKRAD
mmetsp:Transcript_2753/g.3209  ORF Transcript_2753/g.3209 Transcript_2753/m.3209 type:complete len:550 (+) Transcript_2753:27-1676(+)